VPNPFGQEAATQCLILNQLGSPNGRQGACIMFLVVMGGTGERHQHGSLAGHR